uniref:Uncharacterized protein MANES_13G030700 n=1 Tax=Rhizophora mucronata TaxID=61149 RepID=A0A2P2INA8_RHIMU
MAANGVRRTLQFSSASAKSLFTRSSTKATATTARTTKASPLASKSGNLSGFSPSQPIPLSRSSLQNLTFSRLPVELGGALSLMPLHSVTASALFTSLLSLHNDNWGCLSEGFATPL